ncbi:ATP-binding protein [Mangrovihabitans endophyticus]|uniref:STAS domain-containing protein n=1 Tax=Mangrovihabitans endophyticus TaxID=1751298 RepID=A0A8J3FQI8_9ACTN|nr:ATP-binding protein [Mangrovihabitans endophyticus]GGL03639.1 hypothetical protein GCM10012284_42800 [Mangrovihabitans endophyticus]
MTSQLVCRPEQDLPVGLLRVGGKLDAITSTALRHAIARSLSTQPDKLVVDIAGMTVVDPHGLNAFSDVLCQTSEWPGVPVVLCGASAETADTVAAWPGCQELRIAQSWETEMAEDTTQEESRRIRVRLRPVPDACRQARQLVTKTCAAWQLSGAASTAALVASELVANVVRHAHTTMEFTLGMRGDRICLTVRDSNRRMPRLVAPGSADAGGRGLRLVRELTESWGVLPVPGGKVVWSHLAPA